MADKIINNQEFPKSIQTKLKVISTYEPKTRSNKACNTYSTNGSKERENKE